MEVAIIIWNVTVTWMFLAYNVNRGFMKQILYMIVLLSGILNIWVAGASATATLEELMGIYLKVNTYFIITYLFVYFLQFLVDKIRTKKKREAVEYD